MMAIHVPNWIIWRIWGIFVGLRDDGEDHAGWEAEMWGYLPAPRAQNYKSSWRKGKNPENLVISLKCPESCEGVGHIVRS